MKAWLGAFVVALAAWSQPVLSQGFAPWHQAQGQRAQPDVPSRREAGDMRRERRFAPERDEHRSRRLTDEERRDLRRDIDQANREIYRPYRGR
ncbi:MAG: hypothetical protein ACK4N4_06880 [Burkholderiales bacterium]